MMLELGFYGRMPFWSCKMKYPVTWLLASVAFAFNSLAQGPVTQGFSQLTVRGSESELPGL